MIGLAKWGRHPVQHADRLERAHRDGYDSGQAETATPGGARDPIRVRSAQGLVQAEEDDKPPSRFGLAGIAKGERARLDTTEFRTRTALLHVVRAFADAAIGAPGQGDSEELETELRLEIARVIEQADGEPGGRRSKKKRKSSRFREQHPIIVRLKDRARERAAARAVALSWTTPGR